VSWVLSNVRLCGICDDQRDVRAGFLGELLFPLRILIPLAALHSLIVLSSVQYSLDTDSVIKSPALEKEYKMGDAYSTNGRVGNANKMIAWKPEERRSFGRPWHIW
jgi:hypothetical protein